MKILRSMLSWPLLLLLRTIALRPSLIVNRIVCSDHSGKQNAWVCLHHTCVVSCKAHEVSSAADVAEQQSAHMLSWRERPMLHCHTMCASPIVLLVGVQGGNVTAKGTCLKHKWLRVGHGDVCSCSNILPFPWPAMGWVHVAQRDRFCGNWDRFAMTHGPAVGSR